MRLEPQLQSPIKAQSKKDFSTPATDETVPGFRQRTWEYEVITGSSCADSRVHLCVLRKVSGITDEN